MQKVSFENHNLLMKLTKFISKFIKFIMKLNLKFNLEFTKSIMKFIKFVMKLIMKLLLKLAEWKGIFHCVHQCRAGRLLGKFSPLQLQIAEADW